MSATIRYCANITTFFALALMFAVAHAGLAPRAEAVKPLGVGERSRLISPRVRSANAVSAEYRV